MPLCKSETVGFLVNENVIMVYRFVFFSSKNQAALKKNCRVEKEYATSYEQVKIKGEFNQLAN